LLFTVAKILYFAVVNRWSGPKAQTSQNIMIWCLFYKTFFPSSQILLEQ
jgi:hypothetical protein